MELPACRLPVAATWFAAVVLVGATASAQHMPLAHGMTRGPAPLHERVAQADRAAIGRASSVESGRIEVREAQAVLGEVPTRFALKHRPSAPLPLAADERALFFLRGARPPYLVVDAPREVVRIADDAAAARWSEAVREVAARSDDPEALRALYLAWLDGEADDLRAEALRALLQPAGRLRPWPPELALERARAALDPERPAAARQASALLAAGDDAALDALLVRLASAPALDPMVARTALGVALQRGRPQATAGLRRALERPEVEVRLVALELARPVSDPALRPALERLMAEDEDPRVREQAGHLLARLESQAAPAR